MITLEQANERTYSLYLKKRKLVIMLKEMQGRKAHMAIVIDEFEVSVEGCVTLEDLVEEIVGEIHDETDITKSNFQREDNNTIITNGDIEIDEINEIFKTRSYLRVTITLHSVVYYMRDYVIFQKKAIKLL